MKRAYFSKLAVISTFHEYYVEIEDNIYHFKIPILPLLQGDLQEQLYREVTKKLGNEDFFLVPSKTEVEFQAAQEDRIKHPHKYPMSDDSEIGFSLGMDEND